MAAKCAQRQDSPWHAAKHLERAAEAAKETSDWTLVVEYYKNASLAYREAGRAQSAADALSKGSRLIEDKDPEVGFLHQIMFGVTEVDRGRKWD